MLQGLLEEVTQLLYREARLLDERRFRRVAREETGLAWSDVPPGRPCHIVTNVELEEPAGGESELREHSAFITYRGRLERETYLFVDRREDLLRNVDGSWKIARRKIILEQNVLMAHHMSMFFWKSANVALGGLECRMRACA